MRLRPSALSFHARLTLTIAGTFIGAMTIILLFGLIVARSLELGVVSTSLSTAPEIPGQATPASGPRTRDSVYIADPGSERQELIETPVERLPTLIRWALVILVVFAVIAIALASWISRSSLGRIAEITRVARGLSERHLDRRLNLTGPDDEIKQLGDTFDSMLERLERVFATQRLFIANASHELRTPLTTARTALEIPLAQGRVPDDLRPAFDQALNANRRSEELIASLLLLARGQLTRPDAQEVDLLAIVRDAMAATQHIANAAHLTIHTDLAPATVHGNRTLLAQAVTNLVDNAIRHNVRSGTVWVTLASGPTGARLTIANTGASYSPEAASRLVEPFHRHDATRTSGPSSGFGLGLAIVESVVRMHGGSLTLTPREGGGLTATLNLPATPDGIAPQS